MMARQDTVKGGKVLLLDRLVDEGQGRQIEVTPFRDYSLEQLKASVVNEIEDLLSTRRSPNRLQPIIVTTTLGYGIGDHAGASVKSSEDRESMERDIRDAITRFEPRLSDVDVDVSPHPKANEKGLVTIDANLKVGSIKQQFSFEVIIGSSVQGSSRGDL